MLPVEDCRYLKIRPLPRMSFWEGRYLGRTCTPGSRGERSSICNCYNGGAINTCCRPGPFAAAMDLHKRQVVQETLGRPSLPLGHNGYRVVVVAAVFTALVTVVVILRFYARRLKNVSYGLEDWFALSSTVGFVWLPLEVCRLIIIKIIFYGYAVDGILAVCVGGIGYHVEEIGVAQLQRGLKAC